MISAIILAAGESRRMGRQKLLLPYAGTTLIEHIVLQVFESRVDETVIVSGCDHDAVSREIAHLGAVVIRNPDPARGMISSVRCGLEAINPAADAALVTLGDLPGVRSAIIDLLIDEFQRSGKKIACPVFEGCRGHPLLFSTCYREEVMIGYSDTGLRGLPAAHPDEVAEVVVVEPAILEDVDTPEDYERIRHDR